MRPASKPIAPALLAAALLCGCGSTRKVSGDDEPTLKSLAGRQYEVLADAGVKSDEARAIAAYRQFLQTAPAAAQRPDAMRRLGDLEMDLADARAAKAEGGNDGVPDYKAAITHYEDYLKAYPNQPGNDRVLYQLARAQEQSGSLEQALATLDRLVRDHPKTVYVEEAQFRRGELLFATRDYVKAGEAFAEVQRNYNPFYERALYMQGWSLYKQNRVEEALKPFFAVLDLKLAGRRGESGLDSLNLPNAERELVEDTFRITSISLASLQGAESIPAYVGNAPQRRDYEFRVYEQLGELYIKQDRTKDAADTFAAFARRDPLHPQAPVLQARVIDIYQGAGFGTLALDAKKEYVARYGADSEFRRTSPEGWERAQPLVKTHLAELARTYHAAAQQSKSSADYQEAVRWYRAYLTGFPNDPQAAQNNFLLAELLYEDKRYPEAAKEYEKTAYDYPPHPRAADAGYAALLAYAGQEKAAAAADAPALKRAGLESGLRFAKAFPGDTRSAAVLTNAADTLFALQDFERAGGIAQQVLRLEPPATAAQRRVAWNIVAHTAFERGAFDRAEMGYGEVIALTPEKDPARAALGERLAAAIYKQGEQARAGGNLQEAVGHFTRVMSSAPQSAVRVNAQYDAAAAMLALKDWEAAARTLEDFRTRFPNHPLQSDVSAKLALAYQEKGNWGQAAGEFERLADAQKDPQLARAALWQAAELHEKAGTRPAAAKAYERYVRQYPQPFEPALEARYRLAGMAKADGNVQRQQSWMKEVFQADQAAGAARTDRTRFLGANAALVLAEPVFEDYKKVALVEPLAKQLKAKKAKMEDVLKAYGVAADYGVADVTTAATFQIAQLYQDFGRALIASQRPKKLSKTELEQYNVMLEEQAFPFEEKATELHELNARRTTQGIYDDWVKKSFKALAEARPVRYGKSERSEASIDAIR